MKVWFTADTHFGHRNILKHCDRPFGSVKEMDEALIAMWNAVVGLNDDVWHLGDFAYRSAQAPETYLQQLNGSKHLIVGNHDSEATRSSRLWASSQPMAEIAVEGHGVVLLHYAMRTWPKSHHGSLHLYGHSHGAVPGDRQSCDVGVDCWNLRPVGLDEIIAHLGTLPERGGNQ